MPPARGASLFLAGVWLALITASWVVASANFRTVDRVLGPGLRPELSAKLGTVKPEDRRIAFRHLASEVNRWMFRWWSVSQAVLGGALLALAWRQPGASRALMAAALATVLVQWALGGAIAGLGRALDFEPRPLPPELSGRFGILHASFVALDLVKAALLLAAAHLLTRR